MQFPPQVTGKISQIEEFSLETATSPIRTLTVNKEPPPWAEVFLIVVLEFESGMSIIYCDFQWVVPAWHAFFILASFSIHRPTCQKTKNGAPTSAVKAFIFSLVLFLQLPFFVLHPPGEHQRASPTYIPPVATYEHLTLLCNRLKAVRDDVITPPLWSPLNMREHLQHTCKHLQHVNIRNTSNAGNEGTQQFEEPLKNRRLGWWPHYICGMWISGWNGGTRDDHLDLFQNGGV